ncbi:hypothetical protein L2X99_02850 [Microbacterium sp. KUDC0406]|uniref:hypothetical protein n=1 Tax=Microbacterium sp. KUDC0406 TaxID=2909588 RepID=UPI001F276C2A|nr:hypothetical protein [Microbacterium sp. KUDC0406]UJP10629.1 hypothetical protein L2X99_02850 [Microbacterium sp. KUDC0406]
MTSDLSPIGLRATPEGLLPCAVCGIATAPEHLTDYPVLSRLHATPGGERSETMQDGASTSLPTCDDCRALDSTAQSIATVHRHLRASLGSVATWRVQCALYALSALGAPIPDASVSGPQLSALVHRLSIPGALAAYSRRFSPTWLPDATTKQSARERWSAVDPFVIRDCQRGLVDVSVDMRPSRALDGGPCAWCGTTSAHGRRKSEAWPGDGLCVTCWITKRDGGGWYDAFVAFIDPDRAIRRRVPGTLDLDGIRPWSQARGRSDGTAWNHAGDRDSLRQQVARLVGVTL